MTVEPGPRLYAVKGKQNCRVTEVTLAVTSLNQGDVFILETADKIFVWTGPSSSQAEKIKASNTKCHKQHRSLIPAYASA
ncbi:Gelsolin domain containing protein [Aphelenchoides avenae]|nr:Gelsolin domain containing protein [Aphelenchus avenae]